MPGVRAFYGAERDAGIERDEAPAVLHRQGQQIGICNLACSVYARCVHGSLVRDGDVIGPEFVGGVIHCRAQPFNDLRSRPRARV